MKCSKCGKDFSAGKVQCPYCQAPVHYGGKTTFYKEASQGKVSITDFFSNIFSTQPADAGDKMFVSGTALTTPTPDRMLQEWNKPWLYARFLLFGLIFCVLCYSMFRVQNHPGGLYLLLSLGSLVVPLSVLIFYWEINIPRDIPFYRVMVVFFIGGVLSLIFTLLIGLIPVIEHGKAWIAPLLEEPAKVLALAIFIYWFDIRYIFGGMLIGAAVGAGFSAFEDIFYAMGKGGPITPNTAIEIFLLRSLSTLGGHVTWAAIEGGALATIKGNDTFNPAHLLSPRFLVYVTATMFLHFTWNGGLLQGYGLISLIPVTNENAETVSLMLSALLSLVAVLLSFTLIRQAIFQVLQVANTATATAEPPADSVNVPMLLGLAGPLANALFPLEQKITLGRDPALCNVVFPATTPGVSRRHCVLERHGDKIAIMDVGSSAGTFMNGHRLEPNKWFNLNGDFSLGSTNVTFTLNKDGKIQSPAPKSSKAAVEQQQPAKAKVSVVCLSGPVQGAKFSDSQRLVIGRDPTLCNVVLPPNTPGVSRRHCVLERHDDKVIIMDVGSSAGTFMNGHRLEPNKWFNLSGDFSLGSTNVTFALN